MSDDIQTPCENEEAGLIAYMFTNHAEQAPMLQQLLDMFYRGTYSNTIGVMSAKNSLTNKEELLIVGIDHEEDGNTSTYPLAKVLTPDEVAKYVGPDGKGGWLDKEVDAPEQLELDLSVH